MSKVVFSLKNNLKIRTERFGKDKLYSMSCLDLKRGIVSKEDTNVKVRRLGK